MILRTVKKLEIQPGEAPGLLAEYGKSATNRFLKLFFIKIESDRLNYLERAVKSEGDSMEYSKGYATALEGMEKKYHDLANEIEKIKMG